MNRNDIALTIAKDLLDHEMLDENNFSYNTEELLQCTSNIILERLKDFMLISGTMF